MLVWYDYVVIYIVSNVLQAHPTLLFMPGGFFLGLTGLLIFYQTFELYCKWRSGKWSE